MRTPKARIRFAALAVLALAIIVPVVAYGRDSGGTHTDRQVEALGERGFSGFTFQGRLTDGAAPANGVYDLTFTLYDALTGGAQVGPVQTANDLTGFAESYLQSGGDRTLLPSAAQPAAPTISPRRFATVFA